MILLLILTKIEEDKYSNNNYGHTIDGDIAPVAHKPSLSFDRIVQF